MPFLSSSRRMRARCEENWLKTSARCLAAMRPSRELEERSGLGGRKLERGIDEFGRAGRLPKPRKGGDRLHGFTEAHAVGKERARAPGCEPCHPFEAVRLAVAKLGGERGIGMIKGRRPGRRPALRLGILGPPGLAGKRAAGRAEGASPRYCFVPAMRSTRASVTSRLFSQDFIGMNSAALWKLCAPVK